MKKLPKTLRVESFFGEIPKIRNNNILKMGSGGSRFGKFSKFQEVDI